MGISFGWFLSIGVRIAFPALSPFFSTDLGMDYSNMGLLFTSLWIGYALGHIPGGILGDKYGDRSILVASTVFAGLAIFAVSISANRILFTASTVGFGIATALFGPLRFTVLSNTFDEYKGTAVGITMAAGSVGNTVIPIFATVMASYLNWRYSFAILSFPFFMVGGCLLVWIPERSIRGVQSDTQFNWRQFKQLLHHIKQYNIHSLVAIQACFSFAFQGFTAFLPLYLIQIKDLTPSSSVLIYSMFFALSAIIQPLAGIATDKFGVKNSLLIFLTPGTLGLFAIPIVQGLVQLVSAIGLISIYTGCAVITQSKIAEMLPIDMQGSGFGTLKSLWMLFGASSPILIGAIAEVNYFSSSFLILGIVAFSGVLITINNL